MHGNSVCEVCEMEFKWIRSKSQVLPRCCSKKCSNKLPRDWVIERFNKARGTVKDQKEKARERFENLVIKKEGCWDWKGCQHHSGYLPFRYLGRKNDFAHKASWRIHFGDIPEGMFVCHKCDNKKCTNPEHLFLGTSKENAQDRQKKKRGRPGKLFEKDVKEIRKLLDMGIKPGRLAKDFKVSTETIWCIGKRITWKHIEA